MAAAMKETNVPGSVSLNLKTFFEQVADFMRNRLRRVRDKQLAGHAPY